MQKAGIINHREGNSCDGLTLSGFPASRTRPVEAGIFAGSHAASSLVPHPPLPYSQFKMQSRTEGLQIGSRAPEFALPSANWEGSTFTLSTMLGRGPVIIEFLRGTW
jgi:hypothetical protein